MTTTSHNADDVTDDPTSSLVLPLSPDALFQAIHAYVQTPAAPTAPFLASIGGLPTLFTLATLVTDPLTLRLVLSSLTKSLSSHPPPLPPADLTPFIIAGLSPTVRPDVRLFVLSELQRQLPSLQNQILDGPLLASLLTLLVGHVGGKDDEEDDKDAAEDAARQLVAPATALFLAFAALSPTNLQFLYSPPTLTGLLSRARVPSPPSLTAPGVDRTRLLRVLSFYIDLAGISDASRQLFLSSPLPALLLDGLRGWEADPLTQLNVVELLIRFIQGAHGLPPDLARQLLQALYSTRTTARPAFLTVATLQIAEALSDGGMGGGDWWRDEPFQAMLRDSLDSPDESVQLQAVATLCAVTCVSLETMALFTPLCIKHLPQQVTSSSELVQLAALHGLARVFGSQVGAAESAAAVVSLKEEVWEAVGAYHRRGTLDVLRGVLATPFQEQRLAVFGVLKAVAGVESGRLLAELVSAGWVEWLLDRGVEVELAGLRAKWEVLEAIGRNGKAGEMSPETMRLVREYVRQGPVYVARQAAVMNPLTRGD